MVLAFFWRQSRCIAYRPRCRHPTPPSGGAGNTRVSRSTRQRRLACESTHDSEGALSRVHGRVVLNNGATTRTGPLSRDEQLWHAGAGAQQVSGGGWGRIPLQARAGRVYHILGVYIASHRGAENPAPSQDGGAQPGSREHGVRDTGRRACSLPSQVPRYKLKPPLRKGPAYSRWHLPLTRGMFDPPIACFRAVLIHVNVTL